MMNNRMKSMTEASIAKLEQEEMRMLSKMQETMAKKQQAIDELSKKSKALKKNIEPRGAYKLGRASHA